MERERFQAAMGEMFAFGKAARQYSKFPEMHTETEIRDFGEDIARTRYTATTAERQALAVAYSDGWEHGSQDYLTRGNYY